MDEEMTGDRSPGRRAFDLAPLLRWLPFLSLLVFMLAQTVYVTRYVAGIETTNSQLIASVAEMKAEMKTLSASVGQSAVPNAQMALQVQFLESRVSELRAMANENSRRITAVEATTRRER